MQTLPGLIYWLRIKIKENNNEGLKLIKATTSMIDQKKIKFLRELIEVIVHM